MLPAGKHLATAGRTHMRKCMGSDVAGRSFVYIRSQFFTIVRLQYLHLSTSRTLISARSLLQHLSQTMYIYDAKLKLHINTNPLLVSSRVINTVKRIDPTHSLEWDDAGFVCGVSYNLSRALAEALGMIMLSVEDYMDLARRHPELQSNTFAEWLYDTFVFEQGNDTPRHYPETNKLAMNTASAFQHLSATNLSIPVGRPGWFDLSEVSCNGLPSKLHTTSRPGNWKFWSLEAKEHTSGALRNFVTSSGTCSLDLGIPIFAKHPKIMMRECYRTPRPPCVSPLLATWEIYEALTQSRNDGAIRKFFEGINDDKLVSLDTADEFIAHKEAEMQVDLRGKRILLTGSRHDLPLIETSDLIDTIQQNDTQEAQYVIGHERPDSDSVVSALFEAVRRRLKYSRVCLPWSESIPREVEQLLGPKISRHLEKVPAPGPQNELILVDCNQVNPSLQMNVRAIIDHHIIGKTVPYYVAMSHEVSWSTTLQVYIKILGSGWDLSSNLAKILLDATALEAEPSLFMYMSDIDHLAIERLKHISGHTPCYSDLMQTMINDADTEELFRRDYRQTSYGFAVIKTKIKRDYTALAVRNNELECLPLTTVKQVVYSKNFKEIVVEEITFAINPQFHDKGFKRVIFQVVCTACQRFHSNAQVFINEDTICVQRPKHQTPRLLLMPLIEQVVQEHLRFAYAPSLSLYVAMGFYNGGTTIYGEPGDEKFVRAELSYQDAKALLRSSSVRMLDLAEYWIAYKEFVQRGHAYAVRSLENKQYVELLDTEFLNGRAIRSGLSPVEETDIAIAKPCLIRPADGFLPTGLPQMLHSPDIYGDKTLWRYWSPDSAHNVATRGHIFVMNQTSIDLKVRPDEKTQQLTFRPVYEDIPDILFRIENGAANWVTLDILPRLFSIH
jgi:inorganic pyrophosphatase/exopolyphosphatase